MRAHLERCRRGTELRESVPVRVGEPERHLVIARRLRHREHDANVRALPRREAGEHDRHGRRRDERVLAVAHLPDEAIRTRAADVPRVAPGVGDRDRDARRRTDVHAEGRARHFIPRVRRWLEDSAVHDRPDIGDERICIRVIRVPSHRHDDPWTRRGVDDAGVMREARKVSGLVRDDHALRELRGKPVVDLLALEPCQHPIRRRGRDQLALREEREQRADRARGRDIGVLAPRHEYVEVVDAHVAQSCVDVVRAEHMPKGERRAVIGDRDHRFERLVECELSSRDLERAILGDVLALDRDDVAVVELPRVDTPLGLGEHRELVERGGDDGLVGIVRVERLGGVRIRDP